MYLQCMYLRDCSAHCLFGNCITYYLRKVKMMTKNIASWNDLALKKFSVDKKTKKNSRPDLIWLQTIQILTGYSSHSLNRSLVRYTLNRKSLASIGAIHFETTGGVGNFQGRRTFWSLLKCNKKYYGLSKI